MSAELDERVAREVMGWKHRTTPPETTYVRCISDDTGRVWKNCMLWQPSTDMRAAWDVMEAMGQRGWRLKLERLACGIGELFWSAIFFNCALRRSAIAEQKLAPTGICLAALSAAQIEKEEAKCQTPQS